ncbi:uncharacterized protein C8R40DRAFT_746424 [Lentinula edodes]|uniref:uncharacterized protein n=1 Tax=Lentinula edodes TaxID=5353 RepID=UPI001E8ED4C8|nr:uncharacterized protein C8R40DRAFT_746424 [Lentinula edodes]KAH7869337.1 hypothetical protein C8R40DRAFT_746424 [Lentinula edodes]
MVPGYIFSQLLGGFIGAALIYANYYHAINIFEGGSVLSLTSNITPIMMHHLCHATLLLLLVRWNKPNAEQLEKSYASATYPIHSQLISL